MRPMVDQAFWSDPDVEVAKAGIKLAALWLITNSQTSQLGICGASAARFEFETGLPKKALDGALEALPRAFKRFGSVIFVRSYVRHQFGIGEKLVKNNFFISLKALFLAVKDDALKAEILAEYPEFERALPEGRVHKEERDHTTCAGLRMQILHRDDFICIFTGERMTEEELEVDHVEPLAKGGRTVAENLVAMSKALNTLKNKKDLKAFCEQQGFNYSDVMDRIQARALKPLPGFLKPKEGEGSKGKDSQPPKTPKPKQATSRPSIEEAIAYGKELGMPELDVRSWFDHFEANGWRVGGKTPMKDWQAALRNGNRRKDQFHEKTTRPGSNGNSTRNVGHNADVDYSRRPARPPISEQ